MRQKSICGVYFCLALLVCAWPASATIVTATYTDLTSWTNVVAEQGDVTFDNEASEPAAGSYLSYNTSAGLTDQGVNFVGVNGAGYLEQVVDSQFVSPYYNFGSGDSLISGQYVSGSYSPYIHVSLPGGITAFGVNLASVSPNAVSVQILLSDGETFTVPTGNRPNLTFFGITTNAPITYIDFSLLNTIPSNGSQLVMDNFVFGAAGSGEAPEAGTLALIGVGLTCLTLFRKRRIPQIA